MMEQGARYRRVMVIGSPGAGKTELGMLLATRLGLPFADLDDEHWGAGWTEPEDDVWRARVLALVEPAEWVLAGHYRGTIGLRAPRCDLVVSLELPRLLCIWRLIIRSAKIRLAGRSGACRVTATPVPTGSRCATTRPSSATSGASRAPSCLAPSANCGAQASSESSTCARAERRRSSRAS